MENNEFLTLLKTDLEWNDLKRDSIVLGQLNEILSWLNQGDETVYNWGLDSKIKPGFIALFYGAAGKGKKTTSALLGKKINNEVYRIDLSLLVSTFIGETEKNLSQIFETAEKNNWILFFDEADALFGKRTETNTSNDRYANQEVSYLLKRIEDFPGLIILSTKFKSIIDDVFSRRFHAMIHFQ